MFGSLSQELEEERRKENEVFEDQKFVTREELTANGLDALLGTKYLRYVAYRWMDVWLVLIAFPLGRTCTVSLSTRDSMRKYVRKT